jgi:hypothetical protein
MEDVAAGQAERLLQIEWTQSLSGRSMLALNPGA